MKSDSEHYYVKCYKVLRCGCNPGYWTQSSLVPLRHRHVRVTITGNVADSLNAEKELAPRRRRALGSRRSRWVAWLERHRLTAYPKGLSKRERRALGA